MFYNDDFIQELIDGNDYYYIDTKIDLNKLTKKQLNMLKEYALIHPVFLNKFKKNLDSLPLVEMSDKFEIHIPPYMCSPENGIAYGIDYECKSCHIVLKKVISYEKISEIFTSFNKHYHPYCNNQYNFANKEEAEACCNYLNENFLIVLKLMGR